MIPDGATVGIGGSTTLNQIGFFEAANVRGMKLLNPFAQGITPEERNAVTRKIFSCDYFLCRDREEAHPIRYPRSSRRGTAGFVRTDTLRDDHHLYGFLPLDFSSNKADCPLRFFKGKAMGDHFLDGISPRFRQGDGWNH